MELLFPVASSNHDWLSSLKGFSSLKGKKYSLKLHDSGYPWRNFLRIWNFSETPTAAFKQLQVSWLFSFGLDSYVWMVYQNGSMLDIAHPYLKCHTPDENR
uniref:Uncharacterized protein n=1 Tax=Megaselia scalaris TaxID=36166 RepID=T1H104_MEGSC